MQKKLKDRFDLESDILGISTLADSLTLLKNGIESESISIKEALTTLDGLRLLLSLQAEKTMDTMCQCFRFI